MTSLKGRLLIAAPSLRTPFFERTVILMLEHSETGAMGLVLNRETNASVSDIAEQALDESLPWDKPVSLGGPVPGPLMVLHTRADLSDAEVIPGLYSSVDAEKVRALLRDLAEPSRVVVNYAGWGPGQLENEIEEESWLSCPAAAEFVFWSRNDDLWHAAVREVSSNNLTKVLGLKEIPSDPTWN